MRSIRVPVFRAPLMTDGAPWMWWLLLASLLRLESALVYGSIALAIGVLSFATWSWTAWRVPAFLSTSAPPTTVSTAEVFGLLQVMTALLMLAAGDVHGAAFAGLIAGVCGLRAWSWHSMVSKNRRSFVAG